MQKRKHSDYNSECQTKKQKIDEGAGKDILN
jgi:hypothetical protein